MRLKRKIPEILTVLGFSLLIHAVNRLRYTYPNFVLVLPSVLKLVETKALLDNGYFVVRFNSRGVGRSQGRSSFSGLTEAEDLKDVVRWAMQQINEEVVSLVFVVCILKFSINTTIVQRARSKTEFDHLFFLDMHDRDTLMAH
jgi:hypothetical protein